MDYNQILHISKDNQICYMGGPEMQQTHPRWWRAAILKIKISSYLSNRLTDFDKNLA